MLASKHIICAGLPLSYKLWVVSICYRCISNKLIDYHFLSVRKQQINKLPFLNLLFYTCSFCYVFSGHPFIYTCSFCYLFSGPPSRQCNLTWKVVFFFNLKECHFSARGSKRNKKVFMYGVLYCSFTSTFLFFFYLRYLWTLCKINVYINSTFHYDWFYDLNLFPMGSIK